MGATPPTNRYLLADDRADGVLAAAQRRHRADASRGAINANVLYSYSYRYALLIGRNLNAPVDGVRPDPAVRQRRPRLAATATARSTTINASVNLNLGPMPAAAGCARRRRRPPIMIGGRRRSMMMMIGGPRRWAGAAAGPRFSWRRGLSLSGFYNFGRSYDNTDGAFAVPATADPGQRVGTVGLRSPPQRPTSSSPAARCATSPRASSFSGIVGAAADDPHRLRRQRRPDVQRSARRRRPELRADDRPRGARPRTSATAFTLGKKQVTSGGGVQITGSARRPDGESRPACRRRRATG